MGANSRSIFYTLLLITNVTSQVLRRFENITKSQVDKRIYRGLELSNHMKVLLISDPTTDTSAAALDVDVGSMSDPKEVYGLAHFYEHMLFLGTKKYPTENDYSKYLNEHGGSANAATYSDHTVYFFEVIPNELRNVLDRFSQFFIAPLFTANATDRELNAVNSEHEKNKPHDFWRLEQLNRHLANPNHAYNTFGTGNKDTLYTLPKQNNINVRDELLKFHDKWYSSNIMSLAVLGKESLDELEEIIVKLFSPVKNKNVQAPRWDTHPFKEEDFRTYVYMYPVRDIKIMQIIFPLEDLRQYYKSAPCSYISHLIEHEGPGGITSFLKSRGWSSGLSAYRAEEARGMDFFQIYVDLTEDGIHHTEEIVKLIFQYLKMLKSAGPQKWIQDENKDIENLLFRYKDKEGPAYYVYGLAHALQDFPIEDVLSNKYLLSEWKPDVIKKIWKNFIPEKVRIMILSKQFENIVDQVEPWYGTKYKVSKIPNETLEKWRNVGVSQKFKMPEKNEFIPTNFNLYPPDKNNTLHPTIIKDNSLVRVWFKQDETFLLPKAQLTFHFVSPLTHMDTLNSVLTRMLVYLVNDALDEYGYAARLAGLGWSLYTTDYGFRLSIGGYNHKQHILLNKIMEKLVNFRVDPRRYKVRKENYIRQLKNFVADMPISQIYNYKDVLLTEHSYSKQELLLSTKQLTIHKLEAFVSQLFPRMHVECLIYGNANKEKALQLVQIVEDHLTTTFDMSPLLPQELLLNRVFKLEDSSYYVYEAQNNVHKESATQVFLQCGPESKENNMKLQLLRQIIKEPCFNVLRTKEQLGYIAFTRIDENNGIQGLTITVQSLKHPIYLEKRIEAFMKNMLTYITDISEEEFLKHKEALAANRLEKPKRLSWQSYVYWNEIELQQYHFDRDKVEVEYLRKLTKNDIIDFSKILFEEKSKFKRKLTFHVVSMAEGGAGKSYKNEPNATTTETLPSMVDDITTFKNSHEMYRFVQPYINIPRKGYK